MAVEQTLPSATYSGDQTAKTDPDSTYTPREPSTQPGPLINGRKTSITLLTPSQLVKQAFLSSFNEMVNASYRAAHMKTGILPLDLLRLPDEHSVLTAVSKSPRSFTYIVHYADTADVVATISARQYSSLPIASQPHSVGKTFERERPVPDGTEAWEIKLLAVGIEVRGQGLAVLLIKLVEDEVRRRFDEDAKTAELNGSVVPKRLLFVLNLIKEEYYEFYLNRGYSFDYEVPFAVGTLGSAKPFTIAHLSKAAS